MTTTLDMSWIGRKVKTSPDSSLFLVRAISGDGRRAFLSLVVDPKFVCSEPAETLIVQEPKCVSCPACGNEMTVEPEKIRIRCTVCFMPFHLLDEEAIIDVS